MVVNIATEQRRRTQELSEFFGGDEMLRRFFGDQDAPQGQGQGQGRRRPREDVTEGAGTGFVIDKAGVIRFKQIGPVTPDLLQGKILPLIAELER